jgi:hypothetical protein
VTHSSDWRGDVLRVRNVARVSGVIFNGVVGWKLDRIGIRVLERIDLGGRRELFDGFQGRKGHRLPPCRVFPSNGHVALPVPREVRPLILPFHHVQPIPRTFGMFLVKRGKTYRVTQTAILSALHALTVQQPVELPLCVSAVVPSVLTHADERTDG